MKTKILYEDEALFVVHKPAGIAVQSAHIGQMDVESELRNYLAADARKKGNKATGSPYIGLVHRLDQPVEGVLVAAKTKQAAAELTKELSGGSLNKKYLAVVLLEQKDAADENDFTDYLIKEGFTAQAAAFGVPDAKQARLHYRILSKIETENGRKIALADIHIETGRFHQIRCQMAHHGMPLLGDVKYGSAASTELSRMLGIRQTALCANRLNFRHPVSGKLLEFEVKPDNKAFAKFL